VTNVEGSGTAEDSEVTRVPLADVIDMVAGTLGEKLPNEVN